ncbi:rRNA maturation RNase YbeY [Erysipelotrichaceae bacterium OttesenSCG-928-M19]|nr:rRNA maturation RNase YbeY [Erysipelotrichaceae bacterium OttesenSCG-928-M19]
MITINFINEYQNEYNIYETLFNELAIKAYQHLKLVDNYEISVTLVSNEVIHQMNREYRNKDYITDVISFENDLQYSFEDDLDLGDVFISVAKAIEQANEYQHSLKRELCFLFVHGLLHCLGYDHQDEESEKEMFKLQEVILDA